MTKTALPPEEISRRIRLAMQQAHSVFEELNDLFRHISQALKESDADINPHGGKWFMLPKDRKAFRATDRYVKRDMGFVAEVGVIEPEEIDDEVDDADEGEDDADAQDDKKTVEVTPDKQFIGIRAILLGTKDSELEPVLIAALFGQVTVTPRRQGSQPPQLTFKLKRNALKKFAKGLSPTDRTGQSVSHRVSQGDLSATMLAWHSQPLAGFASMEDVNRFVKRVLEMVEAES